MPAILQLLGHEKDLGGGFKVRRLLPARASAASGPSCSSTTSARRTEQPGANHDVRPHPHIGLATVTYLFEGAMMHRDSLGTEQRSSPAPSTG
jgi:redox-sensitive bicupin YhaK (pirin superfamily)